MKAPAGGPSGRDCRRGTASYHHRCRAARCALQEPEERCVAPERSPEVPVLARQFNLLTNYHAGMFVDAMVL